MKIIAIAGLPGSGKTAVIQYLEKKYHWPKVYFGDVIFNEMKKRGLDINEKNERMVREGLREEYGMAVCAIKSLPEIKKNLRKSDVVLIESMYSWEEYLELKKRFKDNFIVIAVYAPPKVRYERLKTREVRPLNLKNAQARDYAQIVNSRQAGPIAMADYVILNVTTIRKLYNGINQTIKNIKVR